MGFLNRTNMTFVECIFWLIKDYDSPTLLWFVKLKGLGTNQCTLIMPQCRLNMGTWSHLIFILNTTLNFVCTQIYVLLHYHCSLFLSLFSFWKKKPFPTYTYSLWGNKKSNIVIGTWFKFQLLRNLILKQVASCKNALLHTFHSM